MAKSEAQERGGGGAPVEGVVGDVRLAGGPGDGDAASDLPGDMGRAPLKMDDFLWLLQIYIYICIYTCMIFKQQVCG